MCPNFRMFLRAQSTINVQGLDTVDLLLDFMNLFTDIVDVMLDAD